MTKNVWPLQRDAGAFYGNPFTPGFEAKNIVYIQCPWTLQHSTKSQIAVNKRCSDSLKRVLGNIWDAAGHSQQTIAGFRYDIFDGSFVVRNKRGGNSLSIHALGAALDWDAKDNQQHSQTHFFTHQSLITIKFLEEGWIWGGDWSPGSIDAMHFQAARVHP
jgi:hypothetical protein